MVVELIIVFLDEEFVGYMMVDFLGDVEIVVLVF